MSLILQSFTRLFFTLKKRALMRGKRPVTNPSSTAPPTGCQTGAFVPSISPFLSAPCAPCSTTHKIDRGIRAADVLIFSRARSRQHRTMVWNRLRQQTSRPAHDHGKLCGGCDPEWPVEGREISHPDEPSDGQSVRREVAFCPACQAVTPLGLAAGQGYLAAAQAQVTPGNDWTEAETATALVYGWTSGEKRRQQP